MRRGGRLFVIMGVITIFFAFYTLFFMMPVMEYMSEEMEAYMLIGVIIWFGIGITEIAVGILFEERLKAKS